MLLTGGIVAIASRKSEGKGCDIALIILFGIAALCGFTMAGSYSDLSIWAAWCLINAVLAVISMVKKSKKAADK